MWTWHPGDAEMAIALKRAELNAALRDRAGYDAEGHNICLALVRYKDGTTDVFAAYSNNSAIPESTRLGLNLVPSLYGRLPAGQRFGCNGMGQFHTEPKLLNYLCAPPAVREAAVSKWVPSDQFYRAVLESQREEARGQGMRIQPSSDFDSIMLVTEIDCCETCKQYAINHFRALLPDVHLEVMELGKKVSQGVTPRYKHVKVLITK